MKLSKRNAPDFSESFNEFADQAEADAKWISSDVAIMRANPVTHVIDYTQLIDNTNNQIAKPLGSPLGNSWRAEFEFEFSAENNAAHDIFVVTNLDASSSVNQNHIAMRFGSSNLPRFALLHGFNGQIGAGTADLTSASSGVRYFCRLEQLNATSARLTVFTGGFDQTTFALINVTLAAGVYDLKFIRSQASTLGGAGRTLTGIIDNLVFTEGDRTYTEDFANATSWNQGSTGVVIQNGQIEGWGADAVDRKVATKIATANNNDQKWTLRFKATQNSRTFSGGTSKIVFWGLFSEDETADSSTIQDMLAFEMNFHDGTPPEVRNLQIQTGDDVSPISFQNNQEFTTETSDDPFVFYFELSRDGNVLRGTIYSDPNYSKVIETRSLVIIGNPTGLRYIKFMNRNVILDTGVAQWSITDVQLWEGKHPDELIDNVAEFEDNFEFDKGWISTDLARLSIGGGTLVFDASGTGVFNNVITLDLGQPLPDAGWVLRFKFTVDSPFANGGDNTANDLYFGLSNNVNTPIASQDFLGMRTFASANTTFNKFLIGIVNNANPGTTITTPFAVGDVILPGSQAGGSEYFVEFARLSNDRFRIRIYNDAEFTQLFAERTDVITIGITGLRFIKAMVANFDGSGNSTYSGTIDDLKLYVAKRATKIDDWRSRNG